MTLPMPAQAPELGGDLLERTMDAGFLTEVANHPDVQPWLLAPGQKGPLELAQELANPANVAFQCEGGGIIYHANAPGIYEVHSMFLPTHRGKHSIRAARESTRLMFIETDAVELRTLVPPTNLAAKGLARLSRFGELFTREGAWGPGLASYQTLPLMRWVMEAPETASAGAWFHKELEFAKIEAESELEVHAQDDAHDCAAGAALLMALAGNAAKAVSTYNNWASFVGYAPLQLLSLQPIVIDIQDAVISTNAGKMEVLLCRGAH